MNNNFTRRRNNQQQTAFTRQATILRKNLNEWDAVIRDSRGEDWPTMLGRLNAALNQSSNMDKSIDDVLEHFVYNPKQATANAQDVPFFLSTRLEAPTTNEDGTVSNNAAAPIEGDPAAVLSKYENRAAELVAEYEENMVRF
mmetsp:Transcript_18428/g.51187  ORF Transcript_18428/g.51187 Transcript_18428/m.51187 type:complete len:142 (-) Transcript_18428:182-607(-)|eukprot:CAMPEP_0198116758 /NCGR_PEP_ID=MMETSP1442-20131203/14449_1 /TAXON_ID= /ORGANISM="Craspedostauros australis, Strain CCMP3328" /LENGTH=141 /DNA_ID=CAMNT_0043774661 /DNA_START=28 /DNA_END=453 /DNA_ORIENTATION=+